MRFRTISKLSENPGGWVLQPYVILGRDVVELKSLEEHETDQPPVEVRASVMGKLLGIEYPGANPALDAWLDWARKENV